MQKVRKKICIGGFLFEIKPEIKHRKDYKIKNLTDYTK